MTLLIALFWLEIVENGNHNLNIYIDSELMGCCTYVDAEMDMDMDTDEHGH